MGGLGSGGGGTLKRCPFLWRLRLLSPGGGGGGVAGASAWREVHCRLSCWWDARRSMYCAGQCCVGGRLEVRLVARAEKTEGVERLLPLAPSFALRVGTEPGKQDLRCCHLSETACLRPRWFEGWNGLAAMDMMLPLLRSAASRWSDNTPTGYRTSWGRPR